MPHAGGAALVVTQRPDGSVSDGDIRSAAVSMEHFSQVSRASEQGSATEATKCSGI